jgi:MFS family permease
MFKHFNRNTYFFLAGTFVSNLGNGIQIIASAFLTFNQTDSAAAVGGLFVLISLPGAVVSYLSGNIADKFNRKWVCIYTDVFRGLATLIIPVCILLEIPNIWPIYLTNFLIAIGDAVFVPTSNALAQEIVDSDDYRDFNSFFEIAIQIGVLISVAFGGIFAELFGAVNILIFNGITYFISGILLGSINYVQHYTPPKTSPEQNRRIDLIHHWNSIRNILRQPQLCAMGAIFALIQVIVMVSNVLLVPLVIKKNGDGMGILGITDAFAGIGMFSAMLVFKLYLKKISELTTTVIGFLICGVFLALLPLGDTIWVITFTMLNAIFFGLGRVSIRILIFKSINNNTAGRFFGFFNSCGLIFSTCAAVVTSYATDFFGVEWGYLLLFVSIIAVILPARVALYRNHRNERKRTKSSQYSTYEGLQ